VSRVLLLIRTTGPLMRLVGMQEWMEALAGELLDLDSKAPILTCELTGTAMGRGAGASGCASLRCGLAAWLKMVGARAVARRG